MSHPQVQRQVQRRTLGAAALVGIAVAFFALVIVATFILRGLRIDLTENRLYSVAPGTENILESIAEPINLYFFFSEEASRDIPDLRAYAQRVRELLEEMAERSNGKVELSVIDPQPFSVEEDRAGEFGLSAVPAGNRGESLFFGLAGTNSTDGREIIGFFQPDKEEFLEYDIASLIYRLAHPERPAIGLLSTLDVNGGFDPGSPQMRPGWASISQLHSLFDVQTIATDATTIPDNVSVLVILHPKELSPATLYAIDQFALRGGKVAVFVDPQAEQDSTVPPQMASGTSRGSNLPTLLDAWGVQYDPSQVLADAGRALSVTLRPNQPPVRHLGVQAFTREDFSADDVVTAGLDAVNFMTSGVLKGKEGASTTFEPLIRSTKQSMLLAAERFSVLDDPQVLLDGFKPTGEQYTVAARVTGTLTTAFPDGPPEGATTSGEQLRTSPGPVNIIVVADTDVLSDLLWVRTQNMFGQRVAVAWANNGDFIANALDNLTGSADLISIRGRQSYFRPFVKVEELRQQASEQLRTKEQELDLQLQETERNLADLQSARNDRNQLVMTPEQEAELKRFQGERTRIRSELREVRRSLEVDIDRLGTVLRFFNIVFVPALLTVAVLIAGLVRRRRVKSAADAAQPAGAA